MAVVPRRHRMRVCPKADSLRSCSVLGAGINRVRVVVLLVPSEPLAKHGEPDVLSVDTEPRDGTPVSVVVHNADAHVASEGEAGHTILGLSAKGLVELGDVDAAESNADLVVPVAQHGDRVPVAHAYDSAIEGLAGG